MVHANPTLSLSLSLALRSPPGELHSEWRINRLFPSLGHRSRNNSLMFRWSAHCTVSVVFTIMIFVENCLNRWKRNTTKSSSIFFDQNYFARMWIELGQHCEHFPSIRVQNRRTKCQNIRSRNGASPVFSLSAQFSLEISLRSVAHVRTMWISRKLTPPHTCTKRQQLMRSCCDFTALSKYLSRFVLDIYFSHIQLWANSQSFLSHNHFSILSKQYSQLLSSRSSNAHEMKAVRYFASKIIHE